MSEEEARKAERDAIVAWLKNQCSNPMLPTYREFLWAYADAIQRGDHMEGKDG